MQIINNEHFGTIIRTYRRAAKLTQLELAKITGLTQCQISNIEHGRDCYVGTAILLVTKIGLTLDVMDWNGRVPLKKKFITELNKETEKIIEKYT